MYSRRPVLNIFAFALGLCFLGACAVTVGGRTDRAADLARSAGLQRTQWHAPPFVLTGWQRINAPGAPIRLYIEGDGFAWIGRGTPSPNPTPKNPLGLMLASRDPGANVVYLGRPCQYTDLKTRGNEGCRDPGYWTNKRFAPETVAAYMRVLDDMTARAGADEVFVTGYSGGANIAGLLAARRQDITKIRTVAGNLDNDYFTQFHQVSAMPLSLNMATDAARLRQIPQLHFVGGGDDVVPLDIYKSYMQKSGGAAPCIGHRILPRATHLDGWAEEWAALLKIPVACGAADLGH